MVLANFMFLDSERELVDKVINLTAATDLMPVNWS